MFTVGVWALGKGFACAPGRFEGTEKYIKYLVACKTVGEEFFSALHLHAWGGQWNKSTVCVNLVKSNYRGAITVQNVFG